MFGLLETPVFRTAWRADSSISAAQKNEYEQDLYVFHAHLRAFFWELVAARDSIYEWIKVSGRGRESKKMNVLRDECNTEWYFEVAAYRNFAHRTQHLVSAALRVDRGRSFVKLSPARRGQRSEDLRELLDLYGQRMTELVTKLMET